MGARRWKAGIGALVLAGLLVAAVAQISGGGPALATAKFSLTRVAGPDRYQTAALIAQDGFPAGVTGAILADGQTVHFPDALSASYLAGYFKVPVLLTDPNSLPASVLQALQALHVKAVAVIGGPAAVSDSVLAQLVSDGIQVNRVGGATRYDTDAAVDAIPPASYVGTPGTPGLPTAVVASGANFPDALVSGPLAFAAHLPIVITDPGGLSPQAAATLKALGIKQALIAGGPAAVSSNMEAQLATVGIVVTKRFAGTDRTDTATQIATYAVQTLGFTNAAIGLARGDDPADSLAAGPFEGLYKTPTLLTNDPNTLGTFSLNFLKGEAPTLNNGVLFGGTAAVSDAVKSQAEKAAQTVVGDVVSLVATPNKLIAGQQNTATLTATVMDASGSPVANDPVTFSSVGAPTAACGVIAPLAGVTNASGQATATYTPTPVGGTCVASVTEQASGGSAQAPITETSASGTTVSVSVAPQSLAPGATAEVVAKVSDKNGNPVANDPVAFTVSGTGCTPTVVPSAAATDSTGSEAGTFVAAPVAAVCTISATEAQGQASGSAQVAQIGLVTTTTSSGSGSSTSSSIVPTTIPPTTVPPTTVPPTTVPPTTVPPTTLPPVTTTTCLPALHLLNLC